MSKNKKYLRLRDLTEEQLKEVREEYQKDKERSKQKAKDNSSHKCAWCDSKDVLFWEDGWGSVNQATGEERPYWDPGCVKQVCGECYDQWVYLCELEGYYDLKIMAVRKRMR